VVAHLAGGHRGPPLQHPFGSGLAGLGIRHLIDTPIFLLFDFRVNQHWRPISA
jgi:hypothetical protein